MSCRTYNIQAISFTPSELVQEMKKYFPNMKVTYKPDQRQAIGESPNRHISYVFRISKFEVELGRGGGREGGGGRLLLYHHILNLRNCVPRVLLFAR